ncbi:MAG: carboxymuconolactone decarboxylase family protein [Pseudomonadota bacterium]
MTEAGTALKKGRVLLEELNPTLEAVLDERYRDVVPEFAETLVEFAYGRLYAREGLDMKTRQIATVAALAALGGQTGPQLKINIEHALDVGATERELAEVILQMSVYGGMPAAINGLNAAKEVFAARAGEGA